tara:strand:+ start:347 stop:589 length:243 start_codon:yes stop_codon:yes gene_type:complete
LGKGVQMSINVHELTDDEFTVIKYLISSFSHTIENVVENDIQLVDKETNRELYHALLDLVDMWESSDIKDAMDTWAEIDR